MRWPRLSWASRWTATRRGSGGVSLERRPAAYAASQRRGQAQQQQAATGGQPGRDLHGDRPRLSRLAPSQDLSQSPRDGGDQASAGMHAGRQKVIPSLGSGGRVL